MGGGGTDGATEDEEHPASRLEDPELVTRKAEASCWHKRQTDQGEFCQGPEKSPLTIGTTLAEEFDWVDAADRPEHSSHRKCTELPTTLNATRSTE